MKTIMTPEEYSLFLEVAKHLNLSKAAQELYMSPSALSRRISQLEKDLDVVLFERTVQGVQLTPGGKLILDQYNSITETFQIMLNRAKLYNTGYVGLIKIGVQDGHELDKISMNFIKEYSMANSGLELDIQCFCHSELLDKVKTGRLDMGFMANFDSSDLDNVDYFVTSRSQGHILLPSNHPFADKEKIEDFSFLNNETLVITDSTVARSAVRFVHNICRSCRFYPKDTKLASAYSTMILWVIMGMGFAITSKNIWYGHPKIKFFPLPDHASCNNIVIWDKNSDNPALKRFIDEMKICIER